jgi:hypothetical protein
MSAAEQTVELVETKEIQLFLPVMKEIDFGDRFLLSTLHWCGILVKFIPYREPPSDKPYIGSAFTSSTSNRRAYGSRALPVWPNSRFRVSLTKSA